MSSRALRELSWLLRPAGGGLYLVSTGRAEQRALQRRFYEADSEADVTERDWIAFRACLNLWDWQKNGGKAA